ncbi:MAG: LamG-like jellyroll fold domain-containing protein [Chloroflexota bacterium]
MDETSGSPFADSVGTSDGSCTAPDCPTPEAGRVNGAQTFDGTNRRINVPASTDFNWTASDSFSIALWVNIHNTATCSGNKVFIGRYGGGTAGNQPAWWVGCDESTNRATVSLRDNNNINQQVTAGDIPLNDGGWHHIVAVREGGSVNQTRIYVDGSFKNYANVIFTGGFASSNGLSIGYYNLDF